MLRGDGHKKRFRNLLIGLNNNPLGNPCVRGTVKYITDEDFDRFKIKNYVIY